MVDATLRQLASLAKVTEPKEEMANGLHLKVFPRYVIFSIAERNLAMSIVFSPDGTKYDIPESILQRFRTDGAIESITELSKWSDWDKWDKWIDWDDWKEWNNITTEDG
jgi:hypothetical protein